MGSYRNRIGSFRDFISRNKKQLLILLVVVILIIVAVVLIVNAVNRQNFDESFLATDDVIRIGIRTDLDNFGQVNEQGEIEGFDKDYMDVLLNELFPDGGKLYEYVSISSQDAGANIKYGHTDINIGMLIPGSRKVQGFEMTRPYYTDRAVAVAHGDSKLETIDGVLQGNIGYLYATIPESSVEDFMDNKNIQTDLLRYSDYESVMVDIQNGRVDAVIVPELVGRQFERAGFRVLAEPLFEIGYSIMLPSGQSVVANELDHAIAKLEQEGTTTYLREKWGL